MEHKNRERNSPRVRHAWQTPSLRNHRTEHRAESRTAMSTINRADQRSDRLHAGWRLGSDGLRLPWLDRHFCTKRAALLLLATFGMQGATSVWNAPFAATSGLNRPGPPPGRSIAPPISRVFRFLCVCIPTGAASVAKSGFFLEFWCCVHNSPDFKHTIPGLRSLHNPRILCNPGIVAPVGYSLELLWQSWD